MSSRALSQELERGKEEEPAKETEYTDGMAERNPEYLLEAKKRYFNKEGGCDQLC